MQERSNSIGSFHGNPCNFKLAVSSENFAHLSNSCFLWMIFTSYCFQYQSRHSTYYKPHDFIISETSVYLSYDDERNFGTFTFVGPSEDKLVIFELQYPKGNEIYHLSIGNADEDDPNINVITKNDGSNVFRINIKTTKEIFLCCTVTYKCRNPIIDKIITQVKSNLLTSNRLNNYLYSIVSHFFMIDKLYLST